MAEPFKACAVCGCNNKRVAHNFCGKHLAKFYKYGDPLAQHPNPRKGMRERWLIANVNYKGDDCLIWPFSVGSNGRGSVQVKGRQIQASRYMCFLAHGDPPSLNFHAAHNCGNGHKNCMNPNHLRWATPSENEADKIAHGTVRFGSIINTSKLTLNDAMAIIRSSDSGVSLAKRYGVTPAAISSIRRGRNWKSAHERQLHSPNQRVGN